MSKFRLSTLFIFILLTSWLVACGANPPDVTTTDPVGTLESVPTATNLVATPTPTQTPLPERVLLVSDPASGFLANGAVQSALERLSMDSGWQFETTDSLTIEQLDDGVRIVVMTPPAVNLSELAAASPETQFVVIGVPEIELRSNVSVIGPEGERPDNIGFVAGYLAAVVTEDWRVGVLSASDTISGKAAGQSFLNGAIYFCGLCNPPFPPFDYPLIAALPVASSSSEWQAAADSLINPDKDVRTLFIAQDSGDPGIYQYVFDKNVLLIGTESPPEAVKPLWVATVYADPVPALEAMWPELLAGNGGQSALLPVRYGDVNPAIFTPGRQLLVDKMLSDLESGLIDTGVDPLTGESR